MPDQFGGIEVDESPSTPPTLPEVQRDQFGGISVDDEALRFATTVPQQITGRLARGIELGALAQPEPPQPRRAVVTRAGVREVPPGVPLPGERPLSTDLERLAQSIPQGQNIVTRPLSSLARTGLSFASAATAPENVPATVALASPLAPVAEAYFGYQMGKGAVESAKQIYDLMRQPGPVDEAFKQKLSDAIVNAEALGVGATGIGADLLRKAKNKVGGVVRPALEEIRPAPTPVAPEAAPTAPAPAPTPLTAAEQAAERARLASELGQAPTGEFERVTKAQEALEAKKEAALGKGQYVSVLEQSGLTKSQLANVGTLSLAEVKELSRFANAGELNRENFATRLRQAKEIAARGAKTEAIDIASEVTPAPSILQLGPVPEVSVEPVSPVKPKVAVKNLDYGKRRVEKRIGDKWDDENGDDLAFPIVPAIDDISLEAARNLNPNAQPGEMVVVDIKRNGDLEVRRVKEPAAIAPKPAPVAEAPVEATAPARPEVANLGDPSTKPNRFGDPAGTTYYATPEDWQAWKEHDARFKKISRDFIEAMRGGDPEKIAEAQKAQLEVGKEHEAFREKYGGMNPEPPKALAAEPEAAAPTHTGADAIEIVGKPLGEWFKAKTSADLPKGTQRVELAGRIRAKSTKPKDILSALKNEQDRIRRVVTEMAKPPLSPEEAIPMVQPAPKNPQVPEIEKAIIAGDWDTAQRLVNDLPEPDKRGQYTYGDAVRLSALSEGNPDITRRLTVRGKPLWKWINEVRESKVSALPAAAPPTAAETPPQAAAKPPLPKLVSDVLGRSDRDANWVWMHATPEEKAAVDQWIVNTKHPSATQPGTPESRFKALVSEQTGPGPIGMGAAVSKEFEHDPRTPTGIRNAIVDKERVKRGLPEAMKAARRSFGEVWDRAMALIDRDPTTQDELLNTLRDKPRALTDTEDALVLHRQIDLQNEYGKATRDLTQAFDDGRLDDVARERVRVASLADKLLDIYNIGKTSGTETARGLSARRMMANEDFTLARMVTEKRAANQGKPLTDAQNAEIERLNKIIERTQKALDDFQKREAERRGGGPPPTTPPRIDPELERIKADNERAKREYREGLARDRLKERTSAEKAMDWLVQLRQGFVLSGPTTLAKLVSAAIQRMVFTPTEEVVGAGLSKVIPSVASKAAREGGINARAEARALTEGFTAGMRDAWDVMRTGRSSLDIVYGKGMRYPMAIPGLKYIGFLHGALKSATKRNEFARSFEKRAAAAIAQGVDVSDPFVQASIGLEAYKDANRSIFLQDNRVVTAYKAALATLEKRARDTGKTSLAAKGIATTGKILLPIVRVPTNIVAETLQYATGSVTGSARLARAFAKGIENLQPAEADIIMRNLKKGSIGAAVLALGYLNADVIGGYYEPGKRKPQDVPFGRVRVYGYDIPSYLLHNPLLETLQIGATARRLAESKLSKKDMEAQGIGWATLGAGMGLLEEVPFLRETVELAKTFRAGERRQFLGELLKSLTVPQGVQWLAATQDVDQYGRPISRKPRTLAESVKTGIPGLREEVPVRPPPKR